MIKEIHFPKIDSTHTYALHRFEEYLDECVCITADEQISGIGRKGDAWTSPKDNLFATFILPLPPKESENLAQLLAYSAIKVLEKFALVPTFKWPNDILLSHKKVAGVMADIKSQTAIVSIGMNVNMTKAALDQISIPATSLQEEVRHHVSLHSVKEDLLMQFSHDFLLFQEKGFAPFFAAFANKLAFIGKLAKIGLIKGRIEALNKDGRLIVNTNGTKELISSGSLEIIE